jgi:outer membrane receptor protein involved in Fe transport
VLTPTFLPGFAATIDYYNINLFDAISSPSQADVIDACFEQSDPNFAACQLISRNPLTGGLSGPNDTTFGPFLGLSNLGTINTSGIDFGVTYRTGVGSTNLSFAVNGNYTITNKFQATPTSPNRECVGYYSISCGPIQPEWSWTARATAAFATGTDVSIRWRYLSGVELEPLVNSATIFDDF